MTQRALFSGVDETPAVRKVSLFNRIGNHEHYVYVRGTPRVVTFQGKTYASGDTVCYSFRECDAEEGKPV